MKTGNGTVVSTISSAEQHGTGGPSELNGRKERKGKEGRGEERTGGEGRGEGEGGRGEKGGREKKREKKERKDTHTGKEVKLPLFTDDIILSVENPKESRENYKTDNKCNTFVGYNITRNKPILCLYSSNKQLETEIKTKYYL